MTARRRLTRFEKAAIWVAVFTFCVALIPFGLAVTRGYLYWVGAR